MPRFDSKPDMKRTAVGALLGAAVTLVLASVLTGLAALPVAAGRVGEGTGEVLTVAAAALSAVAGTVTARLHSRGAALLTGLATGFAAVLVRMLIALACGRPSLLDGGDLAVILCILCACTVTGAINVHRRRRRR